MDRQREEAAIYQSLFDHMSDTHGLILTISEMDDIIHECMNICNGKPQKKNLIYPFDSPEFMNIWNMLIQEPKWKKKSHRALQASLKFLSNYSQSEAIEIMESSIRNGYQGLFELNKKQNGTKNNSIKGITDTADRILSEFARQNNSGRD